jgi:hypothetical protein
MKLGIRIVATRTKQTSKPRLRILANSQSHLVGYAYPLLRPPKARYCALENSANIDVYEQWVCGFAMLSADMNRLQPICECRGYSEKRAGDMK